MSPELIASIGTAVALVIAATANAVVVVRTNRKGRDQAAVHKVESDEKLETIRSDVNSNMTTALETIQDQGEHISALEQSLREAMIRLDAIMANREATRPPGE